MISFRHHVVSLVAVFTALAVGIVLGGGPLAGTGEDRAGGASSAGVTGSSGAGEVDGALGAAGASYAESFAVSAGTRLYGDALTAAPVALVVMPGSDRDLARRLSVQVQAAGGRVTGRFSVQQALLEAGERPLVDSLGAQLVEQLGDPALDPAAATYDRMGQLVGLAVATTATTAAPPPESVLTVRESLAGASLLSSPSAPVAGAPLVLVVLAPEDQLSEAAADTQADLLSGLSATAAGVVVVGDAASAATGTLAALRATSTPGVLATVDGTGGQLDEVTAVLALIGVLDGRGGAFGAASADGATPLG